MTASIGRVLAALALLATAAGALRAQDGMIGINFLRSNGATSIGAADMAGYFPQANWNNVSATSGNNMGTNALVTGPSAGSVVDHSGAVISGLNLIWASATTWSANNSGTPDNNLMSGYIDNNGTYPTTYVRISGIPYAHYAVVAYVGSDGNGRTGNVVIPGRAPLPYSTNTMPFTGFVENSNVLIYEGLSESTLRLFNHRGSNNTGLHGLQIIEIPSAPPPPPVIPSNPAVLKAYYSFDSASNVGQDSAGLNHAALQLDAAQGAGRFGTGSLQLDGIGDYAVVAAPTIDVKPTDLLSVSVWVSRTENAAGEVVSLGDHYGLRINANGTLHYFRDVNPSGNGWAGLTTSNAIPADGSWHHIVAQKSQTTDYLELWLDGVLLFEQTLGGLAYETRPIDYAQLGTELRFGLHGSSTANDFGGRIDELRIFEGVLTPTEIQNLYTQNVVPEPSTWALAAMALLALAPRLRWRRG
jgi:hypothetical protein